MVEQADSQHIQRCVCIGIVRHGCLCESQVGSRRAAHASIHQAADMPGQASIGVFGAAASADELMLPNLCFASGNTLVTVS
jgi:hypothetical protein